MRQISPPAASIWAHQNPSANSCSPRRRELSSTRLPDITKVSAFPESDRRNRTGSRNWPLLLVIQVVGLGLRVWGLNGQSLSMDEIIELRNAALGWTEIIRTPDGFPPLYNLLLHLWLAFFSGDLAARWFSVVVGVLSIHLGWILGRRIAGEAVGLWTALLLALSPFHIWYSQEGRVYGLYILFAAASLSILLRALRTDSRSGLEPVCCHRRGGDVRPLLLHRGRPRRRAPHSP